ncbi:MAG: alcohol dehydrogenase catalytic domain-containing protein [Vicinamibacteria bacterium]|nr:alcohol dehydrogenase catalytic domain-containing protein [Vicinamibacteria bacterium]
MAAVLHGREDVRIEEIAVDEPGPGEVLLRIEAALTCGTDAKVFRRGYHARMIVPPAVFGHEAAGVIEAAGEGVVGFAPGDPVVMANSAPCGFCEYCQTGRASLCEDLLFWNGAYAELTIIPERIVQKNLLHRPPNVQAHEAALIEPLACAIHGLDECVIRKGDSVAVIGAGPLGLMLLVLARKQGLSVVVAGRSLDGLERAKALGAHEVVSKRHGDLGSQLRAISPGRQGFSLVIEAIGTSETIEAALSVVRKGGQINLFGGSAAGTTASLDVERAHYQENRLFGTFHHTPETIRRALELVAAGAVNPNEFIEGEEPLRALPRVLKEMTQRKRKMKTIIRP